MNNLDLKGNKLFPSASDTSNKNSEAMLRDNGAVIARVTVCLAPHHKCSGWYIDFSSNFSIICNCVCHTRQGKDEELKLKRRSHSY